MERLSVFELLWEKGKGLQSGLRKISAAHPQCKMEVDGMPVSPTISFRQGASSSAAKAFFSSGMQSRGFLVSSVVYLMYAHHESQIGEFLSAVEEVATEMDQALVRGHLNAPPGSENTSGFFRLA